MSDPVGEVPMENVVTQVIKPKIYIPNYTPRNNFDPALQFGELIFMTQGIIPVQTNLHETFHDYFEYAKPTDYLLFSGSNLVCSIAYAEWCWKFPLSRNVLVHHRRGDLETYIHQILEN